MPRAYDRCFDAIGKSVALNEWRNIAVQPLDVRQSSAQHDHIGVHDVDHVREAARESILVGLHYRDRIDVAGVGRRGDLRCAQILARSDAKLARQSRSREESLDASGFTAVTWRPGRFIRIRPRQWIVTPFACDAVASRYHAPVDHDSAADSGSDDHAEHHARVARRAIDGFREREAVRVVLDADGAAELRGEIAIQRPSIEHDTVGILDESGARRNRARSSDADRAGAPEFFLDGETNSTIAFSVAS